MSLHRLGRSVLTTGVKHLARTTPLSRAVLPPVLDFSTNRHFSAGGATLQGHVRDAAQFDNDTVVILALEGNEDAVKERLIREIMSVDEIEWDEANKKFKEIEKADKAGLALVTLPYRIGIVLAVSSAFISFPLCFDLDTALWFNERYVTTDVADPEDLETWLETGTWTWNWMEPLLGQLSFFLLCLQYSRSQMERIGKTTFTTRLVRSRAENLSNQFPQYNKRIVQDFSESTGLKA